MYSQDFFKNPVKLNRPLTQQERDAQLKQTQEQPGFEASYPHQQLSLTGMNSTYLETVDRNYPVRGEATAMCLFAICFVGSMLYFDFERIQKGQWGVDDAILTVLIIVIPIYLFSKLILKEVFRYTHYPVRLNRKTGRVYVWREAEVLSVAWREVFFYTREFRDSGLKCWDVRGIVLGDDGQTVVDSFALSSYDSNVLSDVKLHFEYFRRYMEEGPQELYPHFKVALPVAVRKETWYEGFMRLMLNMNGFNIGMWLFSPFWLFASLGRFLVMRTSKIPRWPQWVEDECVIEPNDPYVRESGYVYQAGK
jgi:hypothetical protein